VLTNLVEDLPEPEENLLDLPISEDLPEQPSKAPSKRGPHTVDGMVFAKADVNEAVVPPKPTSMFESLVTPSSPTLSSSSEPDLQKYNESWANLMLELDNLRIAAGGGQGKSKGKKGKSSGVVLETPEMRKLKDQIGKVEKEYMLSRKEAGEFFKQDNP
jgi:hypothetical protein